PVLDEVLGLAELAAGQPGQFIGALVHRLERMQVIHSLGIEFVPCQALFGRALADADLVEDGLLRRLERSLRRWRRRPWGLRWGRFARRGATFRQHAL